MCSPPLRALPPRPFVSNFSALLFTFRSFSARMCRVVGAPPTPTRTRTTIRKYERVVVVVGVERQQAAVQAKSTVHTRERERERENQAMSARGRSVAGEKSLEGEVKASLVLVEQLDVVLHVGKA
jgi:hypothetical protein